MADRIKCTYDDCNQQFDSVEAMKKHKAKDSVHDFYCKRCDEDCDEDEEYLLHQIISPKHICCPICGQEFQSEGGRKRHVTISHRAKQNLKCPACEKTFGAASAFMKHIEDDSCQFIKKEHFLRQRAEKQIKEDAQGAAVNPLGGIVASTQQSDTALGTTTGIVLGEGERVHFHGDWERKDVSYHSSEHDSQLTAGQTTGDAALDRYPPLPVRTKTQSHGEDSLISIPAASTNMLDDLELSIDELLESSRGTFPPRHETIPPAKSASNQDPNAPFAHIRTAPTDLRSTSKLHVERFRNAITGMYICPGDKCDRIFPTTEEFQNHLLTGVHAVNQVQCPCCYKRFQSTHALVAHCESGSMKCKIRETVDFDKVIRNITAGMLAVNGNMDDGSTSYTAVPIEQWGD